ncbi:Uncharacterised protein [uncultured archaeon]|nr:Uncharacterised protein [uncultured archaeon]
MNHQKKLSIIFWYCKIKKQNSHRDAEGAEPLFLSVLCASVANFLYQKPDYFTNHIKTPQPIKR